MGLPEIEVIPQLAIVGEEGDFVEIPLHSAGFDEDEYSCHTLKFAEREV